jgi:DNA integrity scanning protein DisA with diadenylate cyclase activity
MKNILALMLLIFVSCSKTEQKKEVSKKEQQIDKYLLADLELESEDEKITLLSILKKTSKDSIILVMRDYLSNTESDSIPYKDVINKISQKNNISNNKVASIIFSYKYEMLTKDDITNEFTENESNYQQQTSDADRDSESNLY